MALQISSAAECAFEPSPGPPATGGLFVTARGFKHIGVRTEVSTLISFWCVN